MPTQSACLHTLQTHGHNMDFSEHIGCTKAS